MVTSTIDTENTEIENMVLLEIDPKIKPADTPLQEYQASKNEIRILMLFWIFALHVDLVMKAESFSLKP